MYMLTYTCPNLSSTMLVKAASKWWNSQADQPIFVIGLVKAGYIYYMDVLFYTRIDIHKHYTRLRIHQITCTAWYPLTVSDKHANVTNFVRRKSCRSSGDIYWLICGNTFPLGLIFSTAKWGSEWHFYLMEDRRKFYCIVDELGHAIWNKGPLLLTWLNFNPSMDK